MQCRLSKTSQRMWRLFSEEGALGESWVRMTLQRRTWQSAFHSLPIIVISVSVLEIVSLRCDSLPYAGWYSSLCPMDRSYSLLVLCCVHDFWKRFCDRQSHHIVLVSFVHTWGKHLACPKNYFELDPNSLCMQWSEGCLGPICGFWSLASS